MSITPQATPAWSGRTDWLVAAGCGAVALINYYSTLCPTVGPGDSGELTLAALRLGVAHPPGYALFTWLGRIACLFPAPEPALATNLLTAVIAAVAVSFLFVAARRLGLSLVGAAVAALSFGFGSAFWSVATVHEVYALTILFLCSLLILSSPRPLLLSSFLFGLALAHNPTVLLWLPALVVLAWPELRTMKGVSLLSALLLAFLGLSSTLGTLVLASTHPSINWGEPSTPGRLWQHFTAAQYRDLAFSVSSSVLWSRLRGLPLSWGTGVSYPAVLTALIGLGWFLLRHRRFLLVCLLLGATAFFATGYRIPDYSVHLLPSMVAVALLAGAGATWLESRVAAVPGYLHHPTPRWYIAVQALAVLLLLVIPGHTLLTHRARNAENRNSLVRTLAENYLMSLPDSAVLFYGGDLAGNAVRYVQVTRRVRSDVLPVAADRLLSADYYNRLRAWADLPAFNAQLATSPSDDHDKKLQAMLAGAAEALGHRRPVYITTELVTPALFSGPVIRSFRVLPEGIVNRLVPRPDSIGRAAALGRSAELWRAYRLTDLDRPYADPDYRFIQITYAGTRANFGMFCFEQGWLEEARSNLLAALKMPAPEEFRAVVRHNLDRVAASIR